MRASTAMASLFHSAAATARRTLAPLAAFALVACAGGPLGGTADEQLPTGGYASSAASPVLTTSHDWLVEGRPVRLVLSEPAQPQRLPVIVYLPGLGEVAGSGDRWRAAWADAGYAVVSLQPLLEDETAWTSSLARDGDFKALGRERYGADATRQRVASLRAALSEARRRSRLGEAAWSRIDWDRAAIAGFDLGAYTALASLQAGQSAPDAAEPVRFRAALVISPYASVPRRAADERRDVDDVPVLAIGGDADGDPLGIVDASAPADRFLDGLRGRGSLVLWMAGLTHANLSGSAAVDRANERKPQASGGEGLGRRRKGSASADAGLLGPRHVESGEPEIIPDLSPAAARARMQQAAQVGTAFLDAVLRGDDRARAWLATSAQPWLGARGELRRPGAGERTR